MHHSTEVFIVSLDNKSLCGLFMPFLVVVAILYEGCTFLEGYVGALLLFCIFMIFL